MKSAILPYHSALKQERYHMKKIVAMFVVALSLCTLTIPTVHASVITGSIRWETEGIEASSPWNDPVTSLDWNITPLGNGTWEYQYLFSVPESTTVNRFVLQTSDFFTIDNVLSTTLEHNVDLWDLGHSTLYGISFTNLSCTLCTIAFTSDIAPLWGSFASDGSADGYTPYGYNSNMGSTSSISLYSNAPFGLVPIPGASEVTLPGSLDLFLFGGLALSLFIPKNKYK